MSCTNPLLAVDFGVDKVTGLHRLRILPKRIDNSIEYLEAKYGDSLLCLPCGKCESCQLTHRKNWSIRCMLESKGYLQNSFVTLTYDNDNYEETKANRKEDLQKFIHAVRDSGYHFRYFACGEYGSLNGRFHYHIIMFGFWPRDAKSLGKKFGNMYYSSEWLSKKWKKGNVVVGEFSEQTAQYVAGYTNKKSELGKQAFITMSNRPGLGYDYFITHRKEIMKYGVILGPNGAVYFLPKYCDHVLSNSDVDMSFVKERRIDEMKIGESADVRKYACSKDEILSFKEKQYKDKLSKKRRSL